MKNTISTLLILFLVSFSYAQDIIVQKEGEEIKCKVSEIGSAEIKYQKWENLEGPLYSIKRSEVQKIRFENGHEEIIEQNVMSVTPDSEIRQYKRAFTTRPFSVLAGHVCLGYQQAFSSNRALVTEIGWIGPRIGKGLLGMARDDKGAYARIGYRLKRTPEVITEDMEWGHNLGGVYIQPEIAISVFGSSQTVTTGGGYDPITGSYTDPVTEERKETIASGAFLITFGKQMIAGDILTFDVSGSLGFSVSTESEDFRTASFYSHNSFGSNFPLAWNFTISMGILTK